jgi:hypothetical protein
MGLYSEFNEADLQRYQFIYAITQTHLTQRLNMA